MLKLGMCVRDPTEPDLGTATLARWRTVAICVSGEQIPTFIFECASNWKDRNLRGKTCGCTTVAFKDNGLQTAIGGWVFKKDTISAQAIGETRQENAYCYGQE